VPGGASSPGCTSEAVWSFGGLGVFMIESQKMFEAWINACMQALELGCLSQAQVQEALPSAYLFCSWLSLRRMTPRFHICGTRRRNGWVAGNLSHSCCRHCVA
jgi:hypothetical protein